MSTRVLFNDNEIHTIKIKADDNYQRVNGS